MTPKGSREGEGLQNPGSSIQNHLFLKKKQWKFGTNMAKC